MNTIPSITDAVHAILSMEAMMKEVVKDIKDIKTLLVPSLMTVPKCEHDWYVNYLQSDKDGLKISVTCKQCKMIA